MSFPRYERYKDSGIEWLGEVPEHWASPEKLGIISSLKGRLGWQGLKAEEYLEEGPYVVSSAHFSEFRIRWEECPRVSQKRYETDSNIQLKCGDILLMKDGAAMGKLAFVDTLPGEACLNSHLLLFRPIIVDGAPTYSPKFAFYFMQTAMFQEYIKINGTGATFLGISQEAIATYKVVWPSFLEQCSITAFLDRETAKIDALMAEQQRLIELLKEKRQAVISHAVTKGLNPNAPMKDSGIEWLGEVPEHWEISRLGFESWIRARLGWKGLKAEEYVDDGFVFLATPNIKGLSIDFENVNFINEYRYNESPEIQLRVGDVLLAKDGSTLGTVNIVRSLPRPTTVNSSIAVITPNKTLKGVYLYYLFQSSYMENTIQMIKGGMGVPHLFQEDLNKFYIPLPPIEDQPIIATFLDRETAKLDELTAEAQTAIALLQERRTALISAAVTGKIDVRGFTKNQEKEAAA